MATAKWRQQEAAMRKEVERESRERKKEGEREAAGEKEITRIGDRESDTDSLGVTAKLDMDKKDNLSASTKEETEGGEEEAAFSYFYKGGKRVRVQNKGLIKLPTKRMIDARRKHVKTAIKNRLEKVSMETVKKRTIEIYDVLSGRRARRELGAARVRVVSLQQQIVTHKQQLDQSANQILTILKKLKVSIDAGHEKDKTIKVNLHKYHKTISKMEKELEKRDRQLKDLERKYEAAVTEKEKLVKTTNNEISKVKMNRAVALDRYKQLDHAHETLEQLQQSCAELSKENADLKSENHQTKDRLNAEKEEHAQTRKELHKCLEKLHEKEAYLHQTTQQACIALQQEQRRTNQEKKRGDCLDKLIGLGFTTTSDSSSHEFGAASKTLMLRKRNSITHMSGAAVQSGLEALIFGRELRKRKSPSEKRKIHVNTTKFQQQQRTNGNSMFSPNRFPTANVTAHHAETTVIASREGGNSSQLNHLSRRNLLNFARRNANNLSPYF